MPDEAAKPERIELNLNLAPAGASDQPVLANFSRLSLAPGLAYIDFGFIEPGLVAALAQSLRSGAKPPAAINGRLAVRVAMGIDTLSQLEQQLGAALRDLRASAPAQAPPAAKLAAPAKAAPKSGG